MASEQQSGRGGGRKRRLTPQEKYQVYLEVVSGGATQREVADRWGIDRSTVVHICKLAKRGALDTLASSRPGRPGKSAEQAALEDAQAEIARLREALAAQAVELHLYRGKGRWD